MQIHVAPRLRTHFENSKRWIFLHNLNFPFTKSITLSRIRFCYVNALNARHGQILNPVGFAWTPTWRRTKRFQLR